MTIKEIMQRQQANQQITELIKDDSFIKKNLDFLKQMIIQYPNQRFGQIICNYICPSYRNIEPDPEEMACMNRLFPGNPDPFYEESVETLNRLMKE